MLEQNRLAGLGLLPLEEFATHVDVDSEGTQLIVGRVLGTAERTRKADAGVLSELHFRRGKFEGLPDGELVAVLDDERRMQMRRLQSVAHRGVPFWHKYGLATCELAGLNERGWGGYVEWKALLHRSEFTSELSLMVGDQVDLDDVYKEVMLMELGWPGKGWFSKLDPVDQKKKKNEIGGLVSKLAPRNLRMIMSGDELTYPITSFEQAILIAQMMERAAVLHNFEALVSLRSQLVMRNVGLARSVTDKLLKKLDKTKLFNEGVSLAIEGLMKAGEKFDYRQGVVFSTYAEPWIMQMVSRGIHEYEKPIRIPVHHAGRLVTRDPATEAKNAKQHPSLLRARRASNVVSLETPVGNGDGLVLADLIVGPDDTAEEATQNLLADVLNQMLANLTKREADVVTKYFLQGDTMEQIGAGYGITRERVRQIKDDALKKLRDDPRIKLLEEWLD